MTAPVPPWGLPAILKLTGKNLSKAKTAKLLLDGLRAYRSSQEKASAEEFVGYLADIIGDLQQLFSDPYLKSPDGRRLGEKIMGAAFDAKLAEKRELFARALVNGARLKEIAQLDKLRFVDLLISLSKASLVELALIHQHCEPLFLAEDDADLATVDITRVTYPGRPKFQGESGGAVHYYEAVIRELKSAGLFARKKYKRLPDGSVTMVSHVQGEDKFYTTYTHAFARFISEPPKQVLETSSHPKYESQA